MRAATAVVISAVVYTAALHGQHTPENEKNPLAGDRTAIAAGKRLFEQACQSCHGAEGRGDRATPLTGGAFRHGSRDGEIFLNIRSGVRGTQMPEFSRFSSDQAWQLVAYIRSLAGTVVAGAKVSGDALAGKTIFEGKGQCANCHQVNHQGVPVGPDLSDAGKVPVEALEAAILNPGRGRGRTVIVKTAEGQEYRGVLRNEDVFSLQMVDAAGQLRLFDRSKLAEARIENRSLMPGDYASRLSKEEIRDLVAWLKNPGAAGPATLTGGLCGERIRNSRAEPQNWLTYWGDYSGQHFSPLKQIDISNVRRLQARWAVQMPGDGIVESVPLVVDGVMYTAGPPGQVFALDARTGRQIWKYQRAQKAVNPYESNRVNRGVAVLGNRVFFGTLDAALVALDTRTGVPVWEVQVADTMHGYSITGAPLAVKDMVITGVAGGEYGIRGFIDAYDAATGKRVWRFQAVPGPGEFGNDTWSGDSWRRGSGGTWLTGSYDPDLNTLYWTVGNPGPDGNGDVRQGDNLFTCSVVALDAATGRRKWHYQFTPNDTHDWDATEDVVLVDRMYQGKMRKLLMQADRNGVFYVLDRTDGKFLLASPFVRASWATGWEPDGRPITAPGWRATPEGNIVFPALIGGTNFQAPSYSPLTGWMYVAYHDGPGRFSSGPPAYEPGKQYWGSGSGGGRGPRESETQGIVAIDPESGRAQWKFELTQASLAAGVLSTGGGLVFAASREGNFIALDARSGKALWPFQAGADIPSSPMSYAVDGKQFVAVSSAGVLYSFALPD
jgi:PQQ-dependent dehydrogenase (methanol/ethanol family)